MDYMDRIEVSSFNGSVLKESNFQEWKHNDISKIVNFKILDNTPDIVNDSFVFVVPEPFGSYQQNLYNQKATPVFRQNCFYFEASKPLKASNRFPKKLAPKRLFKSRSIRI